jgi:hypothetical protein
MKGYPQHETNRRTGGFGVNLKNPTIGSGGFSMRIKVSALLLALLMMIGLAPASHAEVGTATVFLLLAPGARANAMGQAFVAVSDDATAAFFNPAGLSMKREDDYSRELFLMHSPWMPVFDIDDLYLEYFAYNQAVPQWGHFGLSVNYLNVGDVMETDSEGNELGTFRVYDIAVNLTYSTRVLQSMSLGGTVKYIRSQLHPEDGVGTDWAVDLGWLYRYPGQGLFKGLSLGASLSNLGPGISYRDQSVSDPLPALLRVGLAYQALDHPSYGRVLLSTEFNKVMVNWREDGIDQEIRESKRCVGMEYEYRTYLDEQKTSPMSVFLRGGYYYDREASNVPQGATFGGGLRYKRFQFDFAFVQPPEDLGSTYTKMYALNILI